MSDVAPRSRLQASRRRALLGLALLCALSLLGFAARLPAQEAAAEFRVIAHPSHPVGNVERAFLTDAFLKKVTRWSSGETIRPVDLRPASGARKRFTEVVLKRSVGAVRSYWQQRIFSGRDVPPPELDSDDAVLAFVARHPGAVGYVSGGAKLSGVRELSIR
ncbi:MAG TPA: hypothetical protein VJN18_34985 [Polyangiaceae bacterium]|nr:hypothetical protein [Polyangiaceae bacterium]